jgi:hypothetical protein
MRVRRMLVDTSRAQDPVHERATFAREGCARMDACMRVRSGAGADLSDLGAREGAHEHARELVGVCMRVREGRGAMNHAREDVCVRCARSTAPVWVRLDPSRRAAWIAREQRFKFEIDRMSRVLPELMM